MTTPSENPPLLPPAPGDEGARHDDRDRPRRPTPDVVSPRAKRVVLVTGVLLVALAAVGIFLLHLRKTHAVAAEREAMERELAKGPKVTVVKVETAPPEKTISLPGDVYGYNQATLYAKVSGYVKEIGVERGQRVKKGDVLARIESPENESDVLGARNNMAIARLNANRAETLAPSGVVSAQDRDNASAQAQISRAQLSRALDLLSYTVVRAPFDGVVTNRYVDPGALVPAATAGTQTALPIVDVADTDTLRVFIHVGQDVAPFVKIGDEVTIWQDELPKRRIPAKVTYTAGALDPRTRTMEVEVDLDNRPLGILPGTYAHVDLKLTAPPSPLLPDEAIVIRDGKTDACVIADGKAHYAEVDLGYNDGRQIVVLGGLQGGETVGVDVPVEVAEGDKVQATLRSPPSANPNQPGQPNGGPPQSGQTNLQPPSKSGAN
ncbi:MAG TPA: efflux RND transporter periplasmic adaptor subunit [Polyangiaceae bacterium]|jgi:RND family efflux transporter MFP subunit|nr:efflux RND transporter periplasmic adaptor subunit [Polyangiaceae bacterium]